MPDINASRDSREDIHQPRAIRSSDVIAYWLLPAPDAADEFSRLIRRLAGKFDAPSFEPHVTIGAGGDDEQIAREIIASTGERARPTTLRASSVEHSDCYTKTLFVQFAPAPALRAFSRAIHERSSGARDYKLNPHLSLLYANVTPAILAEEACRIRLPRSPIHFDRVCAVVCRTPITSRADVESWRTIAEATLAA